MRRLVRKLSVALLSLALVLPAGCSPEASVGTVRGEVTLDGQPLKQGLIRFVPADGKSQTADSTITDGKFTATVPPGEMKVVITAPKVVGKHQMYPGAPDVEDVQETLPQRYNVRSNLTMTVTKGNQEKKWELTSK